jgi:hypothetical protein
MRWLLGSAIAPDQGVGRAIVRELVLGPGLKLGDDARGERLSQLDAPLVKGVNAPDRALSENAVFVKRDKLPQCLRGQRSSRIVLDGRLPSKVRCGASHAGVPSAWTSCEVLPKASASAWASMLAKSKS